MTKRAPLVAGLVRDLLKLVGRWARLDLRRSMKRIDQRARRKA